MTTYCTYCSAHKIESNLALPAIELYKSKRISHVHQLAQKVNAHFAILSGKYGLLEPNERINYYDHLLTPEEVSEHAKLVAEQISSKKITEIVFYTNDVKEDPNVKAYIDCIAEACAETDTTFCLTFIQNV